MKKEYLYPITAVLSALILGGSFLGVQINKQDSIERQAQMKIDQENLIRITEENKEADLAISLEWCLDEADDAYWHYVKLNMTEKDDGTYWGDNWKWDAADAKKKAVEDKCFKQYK